MKIENMRQFQYCLYDALKRKNRTQREVAKTCGIAQNAISNYINGKNIPRVDTLIKLLDELGMKLSIEDAEV